MIAALAVRKKPFLLLKAVLFDLNFTSHEKDANYCHDHSWFCIPFAPPGNAQRTKVQAKAEAKAKEKKSLIPVPEGCFNLLPCSALAFASAFSLYEFIVLDLKTFAQKTKIELVILYIDNIKVVFNKAFYICKGHPFIGSVPLVHFDT